MDVQTETILYKRKLQPIYQWLDHHIEFPPLVYTRVDRLAVPPIDVLRMGGSYACFADRPWFRMRAMLCEENVLPYDLNTENFQVRYGVLLWSRFNLHAFTDLQNPDTVYVLDRETSTRWIARLHFGETQVTLTELAASETW